MNSKFLLATHSIGAGGVNGIGSSNYRGCSAKRLVQRMYRQYKAMGGRP